jgi:integrase
MIDVRVKTPTGSKRVREFGIPTREQAEKRLAQVIADGYQGRTFKIEKASVLTVADLWKDYEPVTKRDNDSYRSDLSRAAHLLRHLGKSVAVHLSQADVDRYRDARLLEKTRRGAPPSPASLDHELVLLKRILNYAVECKRIAQNPIAGVDLLRVPNVRQVVVQPKTFEECIAALPNRCRWMALPLTVSFDTGMRIGEVLGLEWPQIDLKAGRVVLCPQETKAEDSRVVYLSERAVKGLEALEREPAHPTSALVFPHPTTGKRRGIPRKGFALAFPSGVHVHDLRRSFATQARKAHIPESVVMKMGGWKTRAVFDRYNVVDESDIREAAQVLQASRSR